MGTGRGEVEVSPRKMRGSTGLVFDLSVGPVENERELKVGIEVGQLEGQVS